MDFFTIIFYLFAGLTVLSALLVLFTKNVLYAAFALMVTFLGVAALFIFSGADFLGVAQLLIYVGGILVLMIFGVMLTNRMAGQRVSTDHHYRTGGYVLGGGLFSILLYVFFTMDFSSLGWIVAAKETSATVTGSTVKTIGVNLMSEYVLPFEVIAILLLLALVGAVFIAGKPLMKKNDDPT